MGLILLLVLLQEDPGPARLQDEETPEKGHVSARAQVWRPSLHGSGRVEKLFGTKIPGEEEAPRISFDRDGDLTQPGTAIGIDLLAIRREPGHDYSHGFRLMGWYGAWSHSGVLQDPLTLGGITVPAGTDAHSRMMWAYGGFDSVLVIPLPGTPVDVSGWVGLRGYRFDFKMTTVAGESTDGAGGFGGCLGGHVDVRPLPFLLASGEVSGSIGFGVPEVQAMGSLSVAVGHLWFEAGYRHFWAKWGPDPDFRLSMGGPFAGLVVRF